MSAAKAFPSWVLLEPYVFRRDDDESFPDDTEAPIRASGTTSWGARFRIAFSLAEPPRISRLYAQLPVPGFLGPRVSKPLAIMATHRHLILFRLATKIYTTVQNFFIYSAEANPSSSLMALLPTCTEPEFDYSRADGRLPRRRPCGAGAEPRLMEVRSMGLWCGGGKEFVVAELTLFAPIKRPKVFADICLLCSSTSLANDQLVGGTWESMRVEIPCSDNDDLWELRRWRTNTIIPFHQWLCWMDYNFGIILCDMSKEPTPTISFLRFPLPKFPPAIYCPNMLPSPKLFSSNYSFLYRGASVIHHGLVLMFVKVTRHDGLAFGALKPGTGFTITCHTLVLDDGSMEWEEDYTVTSSQLWEANPPELLPRGMLMFPQVDMDRPHAVHFLFIEFGYVNKKMWVVSIDMKTKTVESFSPYINGIEGLQTDDADLIKAKSLGAMPFLPCEFSKFLSRKRNHMD